MAKARKGCLNDDCIAKEKKMRFKAENDYCPRCGQTLFYVCRRCRMQLADGASEYCIRCKNKRRDTIDDPVKALIEVMVSKAKDIKKDKDGKDA